MPTQQQAQHTPGPWYQHERSIFACHDGGLPRMQVFVEGPFRRGLDDDETQHANARLIAAAPDLLEACKTALEWISKADQLHVYQIFKAIENSARSAIAKAEGA